MTDDESNNESAPVTELALDEKIDKHARDRGWERVDEKTFRDPYGVLISRYDIGRGYVSQVPRNEQRWGGGRLSEGYVRKSWTKPKRRK